MAKPEMVLQLGLEGGSATIYRTPLASGGWQFHVEGNSIFIDENDEDRWRQWTQKPVQTLQEALRSVTDNDYWMYYVPCLVHPEYRIAVWEHMQALARNLPEEKRSHWERSTEFWQRLGFEK